MGRGRILSESEIKTTPTGQKQNFTIKKISKSHYAGSHKGTVLSPYVLTGRDRRVTRIMNSDPNSECSFLASFWPKGGARRNACVRDGRARWSRAVTLPTGTASQSLDAGPAQVFFAPQAILSNYTLYYNTFIRVY